MSATTPLPTSFDPLRGAAALFGTVGDAATDGSRLYRSTDVAAADEQRLVGVVVECVRRGLVVLDDDAEVMLTALAGRATDEAVVLEARTATAVEALGDAGVETRVLKGVAVAHLDYPLPELRQFGDIDLLVHGHDMARAVAALAEAGFVRHYEEPYDGFDEYIGKGVAVEDGDRVVIDLHRTLALGSFGTRLDVERLWRPAEEFVLAGTSMRALGRAERFVHAALHMTLAPVTRIANGLDLCVIPGGDTVLSTDEIVDTARSWRCADPVARAVVATTGWFGDGWAPAGLVEWAEGLDPTLRDRLAMAAFTGRFAGSTSRSLTAVLGLGSPRLVSRALRGLVVHGHGDRE